MLGDHQASLIDSAIEDDALSCGILGGEETHLTARWSVIDRVALGLIGSRSSPIMTKLRIAIRFKREYFFTRQPCSPPSEALPP